MPEPTEPSAQHIAGALDLLDQALRIVKDAGTHLDASWRLGEPIRERRERLLQVCSDIEDEANNLSGLVSQDDEEPSRA